MLIWRVCSGQYMYNVLVECHKTLGYHLIGRVLFYKMAHLFVKMSVSYKMLPDFDTVKHLTHSKCHIVEFSIIALQILLMYCAPYLLLNARIIPWHQACPILNVAIFS